MKARDEEFKTVRVSKVPYTLDCVGLFFKFEYLTVLTFRLGDDINRGAVSPSCKP